MLWYVTAVVLMAAGAMFLRDGYVNHAHNIFIFGSVVFAASWVLIFLVTFLLVVGGTR